MFRNIIRETPFCGGPDEESLFGPQIYTSGGNAEILGDVSFLSTLRALVFPRMKADDELVLSYIQETGDPLKLLTPMQMANHCTLVFLEDFESTEAIASAYEKDERYVRNKRAEIWLASNKVSALIFESEAEKNVVVYTTESVAGMHLIEALIPNIMHWWFAENDLDEDERALVIGLGKRTKTEYVNAINNLSKRYNFDEARTKRLLTGFETVFDRKSLDAVQRLIDEKGNEIARCQDIISQCIRELRNAQAREIGLRARIDAGQSDNAMREFFLHSKNLLISSVDTNGDFSFLVKVNCENYDPEEAEAVINNERSSLYAQIYGRELRESVRKLLTKVFVDEEISLRFCGEYHTWNDGTRIDAIAGFSYPDSFDSYMPNPHLDRYSCIGDYVRFIEDYLVAGNYIGAVTQCVESCKSLNWGDSAVLRAFGEGVAESFEYKKCYELPDGTLVTGKEVLQFYEEKEEKEDE